jgi:hypothetical protein
MHTTFELTFAKMLNNEDRKQQSTKIMQDIQR